jgi:hypothetical protein
MTETRIEQSGPTGQGDGVPRVQDRLVRYALYLRISTDESRQRWSLQAQEEKLREFVSYRDGVVVAVYRDEASGASLNRPQLMKAIDDAAAGNFEVLAFYRLDHVFHAGNRAFQKPNREPVSESLTRRYRASPRAAHRPDCSRRARTDGRTPPRGMRGARGRTSARGASRPGGGLQVAGGAGGSPRQCDRDLSLPGGRRLVTVGGTQEYPHTPPG